MRLWSLVIAVLVGFGVVQTADAALLLSVDFDSVPIVAPGVGGSFGPATTEVAAAGAWNAAGWSGNYAINRTGGNPANFTTLSLGGLAPHTYVSASFVLGFLESWDGRDGVNSPDELEIWIDGVLAATLTSNQGSGSASDFKGGTVIASGVQANGNGYFSDTLVDMSTASFLTFAHTSSTLNISIRATGAGWQGGSDEGWGIDNIVLTYGNDVSPAVPEPTSIVMLGLGGIGMGLAAWRRKRLAVA